MSGNWEISKPIWLETVKGIFSTNIDHALTLLKDNGDIILFSGFVDYISTGLRSIKKFPLEEDGSSNFINELEELIRAFNQSIISTYRQALRIVYFQDFLSELVKKGVLISNATQLSWRVGAIVSKVLEFQNSIS